MNLLICELSQSIGSRRVLLRCLPYFQELSSSLVVISNDAVRLKQDCDDAGLGHYEILSPLKASELSTKSKSKALFSRLKRRLGPEEARYSGFLQEVLRAFIETRKITAIWYPWIVDHPIPKLPVKCGGMVMDMAWRAYSDGFGAPDEIEKRFILNARKLDLLFPISNFTKVNIVEAFPELEPRLVTIPHATDGKKSDPKLKKPSWAPESKFVLYPASLTENKNHSVLFQAFETVVKNGDNVTLVLTGGNTTKLLETDGLSRYQERLRQTYEDLPHAVQQRIKIAGHVKDSELSWCYRNCSAVVLPTYYEGFGLPLVEALEHSAFIIASKIPPFKEQVTLYKAEDAVVFFDHTDPKTLASLITKVVTGARTQTTYDEDSWTWKDAAQSYLAHLA